LIKLTGIYIAFKEGTEQPVDKGLATVVSPEFSNAFEDISTESDGNISIFPSWEPDALYEPIGGMFGLSQGLDWVRRHLTVLRCSLTPRSNHGTSSYRIHRRIPMTLKETWL
jgi:hypothetical protein